MENPEEGTAKTRSSRDTLITPRYKANSVSTSVVGDKSKCYIVPDTKKLLQSIDSWAIRHVITVFVGILI